MSSLETKKCYFCNETAVHKCAVCGKPLCQIHTRILPICCSCASKVRIEFSITEKSRKDEQKIEELTRLFWGEPEQLTFDMKLKIHELPAYIAKLNGRLIGFIAYKPLEKSMLIAALAVLPNYQGAGVGRALIQKVEQKARKLSKEKLLVSTSNDDLPALAFYQKVGFQIFEVKPNIIAEKHGKAIPGLGGIPIRDEIRLRKILA